MLRTTRTFVSADPDPFVGFALGDQTRELARLRTLRSPSFIEHFFDGLPHRGEKLLQLRWLLNVPGALKGGTVLIARRLRRRDDGHWHPCQARGLLQRDEYLKAIALGRVQ